MNESTRSFQHYEVLRREDGSAWELGRGAMGVTYKAFDVNLCCEVALKVVSGALVEHPEARERFVREARAAAALRHRNVASVYHLGNDGEHFFYAMEFVNGETLDALVRRMGPLSVPDTLRVALQVTRALAAAARQNLVHRDIKPANLMVTHEDADEETVVKVIDFGLAREAASPENGAPLTIGGFVGTPHFASPEQLEERPLDARADLYSLGVTAWFLLTGRVPFGGSLAQVCHGQLTQPPPWEQLPADLPAEVRELLRRTLDKEAAKRPQSAVELRAELEACLDHVQGTQRRRDLHLPALATPAPTANHASTAAPGRAPQPGTLLNRRYRLLREVGGQRGGVSVFQGRDESRSAGAMVAVKILPAETSSGAATRGPGEEQARLAQGAPHPNLVQILALERSLAPNAVFLVEEWLTGYTLHDLLAVRGGALPVAEVLSLLQQASAAADHAALHRLAHLDLSARHCWLCFSSPASVEGRTLLAQGLTEWPEWTLKTHAFRCDDDLHALDTWTGGDTLLPMARLPPGTPANGAGLKDGQYVRALARLAYELLGGMPPADTRQARYALLPALNEEANRLLAATLVGEAIFERGELWQEAFAAAIGADPARGDLAPLIAQQKAPAPLRTAAIPQERKQPGRVVTRASAATARRVAAVPLDPAAGSAWDRLALVTRQRSHPGRWLAGIMGLVAVFMLGFVGVLAWLWQQAPARATIASTVKGRAPFHLPRKANHPPSPTGTTASLVAATSVSTPRPRLAATPSPTAAPTESAATPVTSALAHAEDAAPTSPPGETPRDRSTMVRVDSVPEGAQIRLGDELLGVTPCRVRLPHGSHQLIARYQDWPETRQTVRLDGTESHPVIEIRLMRPELVPSLAAASPAAPEVRARRIPSPSVRRMFSDESPPPEASQPEVRPAQRVLTPFRIDEPAGASPPPASPAATIQPFTVDEGDAN